MRPKNGKSLIKIEAKLGAAFSPNQFKSYVDDLKLQSVSGALLVLAPRHRATEATDAVFEAFGLSGAGRWRLRSNDHPDIAIAVSYWDEVFAALGRADSEPFRNELAQFEAMYRVLNGFDIEPLASREELLAWREREGVFVNLVDRVTRRLAVDQRIMPFGVEPLAQDPEGLEPKGYRRRYVCRPMGEFEDRPCFSIGVRDSFAGHVSPIWLRFNQGTPQFQVIRDRLKSSVLASRLAESSGHIWIPLDVPLNADGEHMVERLDAQADEVVRIVFESMA